MPGADAALVLAAAFVLDGTLREPPLAVHPVVWMGNAIAPLKRMRPLSRAVELSAGGLYVALITLGSAALGWALVRLGHERPWASLATQVFLLWSCFALKGLWAAGAEMAEALEQRDLARARRALMSLCSRDPSELSAEELAGAAVESLTENASDSVVAPLLYFALFGVPGALFYRAANTLDAMVGYRGRFEYRGKVAARLDDVLNFVPARLTALALALAGLFLRMPVRRGLHVYWRDAGNTESPNAGRPMAMAAGLLGVRLDKRDAYVLGAELAPPDVLALRRALSLTAWAGVLAALVLCLSLFVLGVRHG